MEEHWEKLSDPDPLVAHQSLLALVQAGDAALPLLLKHLSKDQIEDSAFIKQLIVTLDHDDPVVRDNASAELIKLGRQTEAQVQEALKNSSLEVKKRCQSVLEALKTPRIEYPIGAQRMRALTAVEWIGTTAAVDTLKSFLKVSILEREGTEAKAALERIEKLKAAK
jgi:hypothetical protein